MSNVFDLAVIGAGPGGYVAAIRAAQLGLKVCVIEKSKPGGVCLNWGCIPSKSLIHQAEIFSSLGELERMGVKFDSSQLDYAQVQQQSRSVTTKLSTGIGGLLQKNRISLIKGTATIAAKGQITLDKGEDISAKNIIIATGSRPMQVPGFEFDEAQVMSSNGILSMTELPKSLTILGAGAIGCEFAYVMNAFGVEVTLVELAQHILPSEDSEAAAVVEQSFQKSGIDVRVNSCAKSLKIRKDGIEVLVEATGKETKVKSEKVLVVFGRVPNSSGLGLEDLGIELDARGYIPVGDYGKTSIDGIFAIGDVTNTPALAHVASKEGENVAEYLAGHAKKQKQVDTALVPSAIYCEPQLAGIGLREDQAKCDGVDYIKSVFPYRGTGKAVAMDKTDGFVKILADAKSGEFLGAHIVGHNATELIHQLALAQSSELLPEDISNMIHAHPTLSEAIMEASSGLFGAPIHS